MHEGFGRYGDELVRRSCVGRPREWWRHAVSKFKNVGVVKIAVEERKEVTVRRSFTDGKQTVRK